LPDPTHTTAPSPTLDPEKVWDYVALGDSNPLGYGVTGHSYVPIYGDFIAKDLGVEVQVHNRAFNGATSQQVLERLKTNQELQQDIREAEIITIDIGANDWSAPAYAYLAEKCGGADNQDCLRALVESDSANFDVILDEVTMLEGADSEAHLRTLNMYMSNCDFPGYFDDPELLKAIKPYLDEFNAHIQQATEVRNGQVVPVYQALNGPDGTQNPVQYLQADGCHLNTKGHQKVAQLLRELGYEK
jgi:lysophospholipase L1-like esterase